MLVIGSNLIDFPILSLHVGGEVARTVAPVIDPESLSVIAYETDGADIDDPEAGEILMINDIREFSDDGFIIDSTDRLVNREDVIKLDKVMDLDFKLIGLKVVTKDGKKLGKVIDYTLDSGSFSIFQLIVQRPFFDSIIDPELTINRSQIVEIDDSKITIKHGREKVKISKTPKEKEFVQNYVNPFRKPRYSEEEAAETASKTSE
jgi:sporulation protein YlmC with PRC-barrel domain